MPELTPIQQIALAGTPKPKDLSAAKSKLDDNSTHSFDFCVHLEGHVSKGETGEPVPKSVCTKHFVCELLSRLGITAGQLRKAGKAALNKSLRANDYQDVGPELKKQNADLQAVFDELAEIAGQSTDNRRSGSVRVQSNATLIPAGAALAKAA